MVSTILADGFDAMKLTTTLIRHCKARGWSLNRLARETKIPVQTLHGWTTGRQSVNLNQLKKVAEAFKISFHELCFDELDPNESKSGEILKELFSGDVRITLHRIERKNV